MNSHNKPVIFVFTPGPIGGAEKIVANGVYALKDLGLDVRLWIIKEKRTPHTAEAFLHLLHSLDVKCEIFECGSIWDSDLLRQLQRSFLRISPKIIHAHGFKASFYSYLASSKGIKFILTHHGKTSHTLRVRIYEWIEKLIMKRSSAVIAVSNSMRENLIGQRISNKKIHVVENILTFPIKTVSREMTPDFKLIFVGRLSEEKGCRYLIESFTQIKTPNVKLNIVGDGIERTFLERLTNKLGLTSSVKFLGFQKDITPFLKDADAFVIPSLREGQPLALIEACCQGLPVLGSRVGGIPEMIQHGQNGLLFPTEDSRSIAMMIDLWASQKEHFQIKADDFKDQFQSRFSSERWANEMRIVYQTVLSQL